MRLFPLPRGFIITSPFGPRDGGFHAGTDFGKEGGSANLPVHAVAGGTVLFAGAASGYGGPDPAGWLVIDHPTSDGGGVSEYGHIIREVGAGQRVEAGQRIGRINPNTATNGGVAPHLHLSVMPREYNPNAKIDPIPWLGDAALPGETAPPSPDVNVTQYGIDISNHQGNFDFARAKSEGFAFATHKILEIDGQEFPDKFWPRARTEMARHFPDRWGGYVFCRRSNDPRREAERLAHYAGTLDFALQIDYEDTKGGGNLDDLWARYNAFLDVGFTRFTPVYIPRWFWRDHMGSPNLSGFPLEIWNSHYVTGVAAASTLYPGDGHMGWADVGDKPVAILQFTDKAQVAGQQVDANAVRGAGKLAEIFGGEDDMPSADDIAKAVWAHRPPGPDGQVTTTAGERLAWTDHHAGLGLDQLAGPGAKDQPGVLDPPRWAFLNNRTVPEALGLIGEELGLAGFTDPLRKDEP